MDNTKNDYGEHGTRMNPKHPPYYYVFTAYRTLKTYCKCDICGEWYEADRLHLCKTRNSYPDIIESEGEDA